MRKLAVVVCAVAGLFPCQAAAQDSVKQELIALDTKFDEARRRADTAFVADFLTDDFLRVNGITALVQTKADILKFMATATPARPPSAADPTYTVYLHGSDMAVMAHTEKASLGVGPDRAVTHVFVKQQGRWKMAAWANTNSTLDTEEAINFAGYQLMNAGKLPEALELFEMNVRLSPKSFNVYDSLGAAYGKAGKTELAIKNYEKSIELEPRNETGKAALAKLKGK